MDIGGVDFPPPLHSEGWVEDTFVFKGLGKNIFLFRNVFSSGPTPAINNDRSLIVVDFMFNLDIKNKMIYYSFYYISYLVG